MTASSHSFPPTPPECGPTLERVQAVLDGVWSPEIFATDPHPHACATCRERVRIARLLLGAAAPRVTAPAGLTEAILAGVRADRRARDRRRVLARVGGLATAAAVVVALWAATQYRGGTEVAQQPVPPPPVRPSPTEPRTPPVLLGVELAKAGDALLDSSRTITDPMAAAPAALAALTEPLLDVSADAVPAAPHPVGQSLAELPDAAKVGLEPLADSAQKALDRLVRDVDGLRPKLKS